MLQRGVTSNPDGRGSHGEWQNEAHEAIKHNLPEPLSSVVRETPGARGVASCCCLHTSDDEVLQL